MDVHRFDTLVRALQPANRRSLLGSAIAGVLGIASLALEHDESDAARRHNRNNRNNRNNRRRRRRRRNRRRTWNLVASPLRASNVSNGDRFATNASRADISIVQRRRRFRICGEFNYATTAVPNRNIDVRDVILQFGNTRSSTPAEVTFPGWSGSTGSPSTCQRIGQSLANDIRRNPGDYFVNVRTNNPNHRNGAVAAPLARK